MFEGQTPAAADRQVPQFPLASRMEIDTDLLLEPVRACLGDAAAKIVDVRAKPVAAGFSESEGGGLGTLRISGAAMTASGLQSFRMISKSLGDDGTGSNDPNEWNYWKREALAYASGVLDVLPPGVSAPKCYGVTQDDLHRTTIFLEEITDDHADWGLDQYGEAAQCLGRFNGAYLAGRPIPEHPWLMPGRVANWLDGAYDALSRLPEGMDEPVMATWLGGDRLERTMALWRRRESLQAALGALPRCFCHHDAFRRNLMLRDGPVCSTNLVGIDWSMLGPGAVGEELAPLIGVTLQFGDLPLDTARDLEAVVLSRYHSGLIEAGCVVSHADVRFGFCASAALFLGLGNFGGWQTVLADPDKRSNLEAILGSPIEKIVERFAGLQTYLLDLGDQATALAAAR